MQLWSFWWMVDSDDDMLVSYKGADTYQKIKYLAKI